jgi:hypothetical protein
MDYTRSNTLILTKDAVVNGTNLPTSVFESKGIVGGSKKSKSKSKSSKNKKGGKSKSRKSRRRRSFRRK